MRLTNIAGHYGLLAIGLHWAVAALVFGLGLWMTELTLKDLGIDCDLGPASRTVERFLSVEGIRQ